MDYINKEPHILRKIHQNKNINNFFKLTIEKINVYNFYGQFINSQDFDDENKI